MSGIGRELGVHGLEEYQEVKQININLNPARWAGMNTDRMAAALPGEKPRTQVGSGLFCQKRDKGAGITPRCTA